MSAAGIAAPPAATHRKPVRWARLGWVTWRQHRAALTAVAVLFAVAAGYLLIMGLKIHDAYARYAACHPAGSAACQQLKQTLDSYYGSQQGRVMSSGISAQTVPFLLLALPLLIGVFMGAPVLARELETGTFRFAWTQGAGRLRWAVAKLVPLAAALVAGGSAFSLLFSWYFQPFVAEGETSRFVMQVFGNSGVVFAAWTLLAFAMAALAGVAIRRTVPAMAAALAACTVLDVLTVDWLRQNYLAPRTAVAAAATGRPGGAGSWVLGGELLGPDRKPVTGSLLPSMPASVRNSTDPAVSGNWLAQNHYVQSWIYQPASRFWPFQLIEGGWLLALSLILLATTLWLVHRRVA